jgi:hypothetical protein
MPLCDGARDAVALVAALMRFRPIIFTVQREGRQRARAVRLSGDLRGFLSANRN